MSRTSIGVLGIIGGELPDFVLRSAVADVELRVVRATPAAALETLEQEAAAGRPLQAALCDLDLFGSLAVDGVATLCRRLPVPVVTRGEAGPDLLLELFAVGAADHLPRDFAPAAVVARVLVTLDRHLTERELRRGHAAFRRVFEGLDVAFAITDGAGRFLDVNPAFESLLGYGADVIGSLTAADLIHRDDLDSLQLLRDLAAGRREQYRVRTRYLHADGREVWVLVSASRFDDPIAGEPRIIAEIQDLSHEVEHRQERDRARESFWYLFDHNPLPSLVLDLHSFRLTATNSAAGEKLGYGPGELEGMPLRRIVADGEAVAALEEGLGGPDPYRGPSRVRIRRRDGSVLEMELTTVRIDHGGRPGRLLLLRGVRPETMPGDHGRPGTPGEAAGPAAPAGKTAATAPADPPILGGDGPGPRILLVDDNDAVRFLVQEMMRSQGYEVVTAGSAEEALRRVRSDHPYDMVVTDASMPGMSGAELVGRLRARLPDLRILVMSGHPGEALSRLADVPFLAKPFTAQELSLRLREILADSGDGRRP